MNLVQLANDLEFVPKEQLAQMSQDPNTSYPPYLVLAEIQRRTQNEKAYAAAQPQPTSTVAEEVVGEFMQPQGMQAGMPPESAPTDVFSSGMSGMPASAPMQMADGGLTGYANRGKTKVGPPKPISPESVLKETQDEIKNVSRRTQTFSPKYDLAKKLYMKGIIDEKAYRKALQTETDTFILGSELGAFTPQWGRGKDIYRSNDSLQAARDASRNEMRQRQMGMASGGLTAYANGGPLEQSFSDPMRQAMLAQLGFPSGMTDEQLDAAIIEQKRMSDISSGSNAPKTAGDLKDAAFEFMYGDEFGDEAMDYIGSIPVGGLAIKGIQKSIPYVSKAAKGLRDYFKKGKFKDTKLPDARVKGDVKARTPGGVIRETIEEAGAGRKYIQPIIDNPITSSLAATAGLSAINRPKTETVNQSDPFFRKNEDGTFTNTYTEELNARKKQETKEKIEQEIKDAANKKEALRIETIEKAERKDRGYDLAQLGGLIMGSKSIGDLGMGIAGMAQQKQARADTLKSEASKDAYYRASAEYRRAELENLPLEQKFDTLDNITETLKQAREGEIELTDERKLELNQASQILTIQILKLQGIDTNSLAGLDVEKELGQQLIN